MTLEIFGETCLDRGWLSLGLIKLDRSSLRNLWRFAVEIKRWILSLLTAAVFSALAGCGGGSTFNVQNPPPPPTSNVSIAFQPAPATSILINTTTNLTATVSNDASNSGVDWSLSCTSTPNCGTLSSPHTASGVATTYTPPVGFSGNSQGVSIVAFATADHTQNIVATINVVAFGSNLKGRYVLQAAGVDSNGGPNYQFAGVIVLDGNGGITSGEQTINFFDPNPNINALISKSEAIIGGSYFLGPDGRGTITINTGDVDIGGNGIESFSLVFLSNSQAFIAQMDFALPGTPTAQVPNTGVSATGTMDLQASAVTTPSGGYAFAVSGSDFTTASPTALAGILNIDSPNNISGRGSIADQNLAGTLTSNQKLSGTVSNPDSFGAITLNLAVPDFPSTTDFQFTGYLVDSTHIKLIESDNVVGVGGVGSTGGLAIGQGSATGTFTSFSGTYVFGVLGEDLAASLPSTSTTVATFTAADNGNGGGMLTNGFTDTFLQTGPSGSGSQISGTFTGPYTEAPKNTGRVRAFSGNVLPHPVGGFHAEYIFYQTGNGNPALVLASANDDQATPLFLGAGIAYPQSTSLTFGGDYGFSFTQQNGTENDGTAGMNAASGVFTGSADSIAATPGDTNPTDHSFSGTYNPPGCFVGTLSDGCFTGVFSTGSAFNNTPFTTDFYIIDPNHGFFVETDLVSGPTGQVSFGYYAAQTLPVAPDSKPRNKIKRSSQ
jgi:hypothetical protein